MAERVIPQKTDLGHTFINAMWIAGFLAVLQIAAVAWAVINRSPSPAAATQTPQVTPNEIVVIPAKPLIKEPGAGPSFPRSPDSIPEEESVASIRSQLPNKPPPLSSSAGKGRLKQMKAPDLSQITDPVGQIQDSLLGRFVETGVFDRNRGNLVGALNSFLDAANNLPDHPRILAEIAGTYGQIGDLEKAEDYWLKVDDLGPILGGEFFVLAQKLLTGVNPDLPEFESGKTLKLGKVLVQKQPPARDGNRVRLQIPIYANPDSSQPDVKELNLRVYFYDLVNGKTPVPTTTAKIDQKFPTFPYDWQENSVENIEVIYHQPILTVEEIQFRGMREYYGYVIELFYRSQLQDTVAAPDELRRLRIPQKKPAVPAPPKPFIGPDTSLFPY